MMPGSTASLAQAEHFNVAGDCEKSRSALSNAEALLREASGVGCLAQKEGLCHVMSILHTESDQGRV